MDRIYIIRISKKCMIHIAKSDNRLALIKKIGALFLIGEAAGTFNETDHWHTRCILCQGMSSPRWMTRISQGTIIKRAATAARVAKSTMHGRVYARGNLSRPRAGEPFRIMKPLIVPHVKKA